MYKLIVGLVVALFLYTGCGGDKSKEKVESTEASSMMLNAKMIDQARGVVSKENKRANITLDDIEGKQ